MSKYNYMPRSEKIERLSVILNLIKFCKYITAGPGERRSVLYQAKVRLKGSPIFKDLAAQNIFPNPRELERLSPIISDILEREYQELALDVVDVEVGNEVRCEN